MLWSSAAGFRGWPARRQDLLVAVCTARWTEPRWLSPSPWQQRGGLNIPKPTAVSDSDPARSPRVWLGGPRSTVCLEQGAGDLGGAVKAGLLFCSQGSKSCFWLRRGKIQRSESGLGVGSWFPTSGEPHGVQLRRGVQYIPYPAYFSSQDAFCPSVLHFVLGLCPLQVQMQGENSGTGTGDLGWWAVPLPVI